ncbi:MAG: 2-hydroxychromene-2-carboxylate isomerase [Alphaproteobacteria bacterium]
MPKPTIEFWFEYGSTYTYLSVMRLPAAAEISGVDVVWRPFLLLPIMMEAGLKQGPFLPFPKKLTYMWRDLERRAERLKIEYRKPLVYPPNTLLTARLGMVADQLGRCREFSQEVFRRHWTKGQPIGTESNLDGALRAVFDNADDVRSRANQQDIKDALRAQTERASGLGIFGSPTFVVGNELFWGDDRLEEAIEWSLKPQ